MKNENNNYGLGFIGALFLVLLVLKLTGIIDWSWWIITAPLWAPVAMVLVVVAAIFAAGFLFGK